MRAGGDERGVPSGDRLTVAGIHDSVDAITEADLARLEMAARGFSRTCGIDADDLLQEALTRALEGDRTCGRGTPFIPFLCGVMQSLASEEYEARKEGRRPVTVLRKGEPVLPDAPTLEPSPEQSAGSTIDDRPTLAAIEAGAAGDEQLQLLMEGIYDGMRGAELEQLLSVDTKGLAAVRKRLKRLLIGIKERVPS
jgi:DNA-directed RNA polymerase specialized sigma24 family protein